MVLDRASGAEAFGGEDLGGEGSVGATGANLVYGEEVGRAVALTGGEVTPAFGAGERDRGVGGAH
jgi:hypothetical protein